MKKHASSGSIESLLTKYKAKFRFPDDLKRYPRKDLKSAERKFLKYVLEQRRIEIEDKLFRTSV